MSKTHFILQEVIKAVMEAQSQGIGGSSNKISFGQHLPSISFFDFLFIFIFVKPVLSSVLVFIFEDLDPESFLHQYPENSRST